MAPSAPTTCCRGSASTRYSTSRLVSRPWYAPYSTMFPINTYKSVYGAKSPLGSFSISDVLFQMYYCSIDFLPKKHRSCNCAPRSTKDSEGRTCRTRKAADLRTSLSHSRRSVTSLRLCHLRTDWSNQMLGSPQSPRTRRYTVVHRSVLVTFLSRSWHLFARACLVRERHPPRRPPTLQRALPARCRRSPQALRRHIRLRRRMPILRTRISRQRRPGIAPSITVRVGPRPTRCAMPSSRRACFLPRALRTGSPWGRSPSIPARVMC